MMNPLDQPQSGQQPTTFTPLSAVQPSGIVNGSIVDGFVLAQQHQQQQHQQKQWGMSPQQQPNAGTPVTASARTIMFGGAAATELSLPICSGCNQPILDKYVLHVAPDSTWHADCLRCAECSQPLDESCTCYVRNGHAYCKADYNKLFGSRCIRCQKSFARLDSIMRVRSPMTGGNVLFHTDCFMCYACGCPLMPGSKFAILGGDPATGNEMAVLLCERDFDDRSHFLLQQQQQQQQQQPQQPRVIRPTPMMLSNDSQMIENHHPFGLMNGGCPQPQQPGQPFGPMHIPPSAGPDGIVMLDGGQVSMMGMDSLEALAGGVPGQPQPPSTNGLHRPVINSKHGADHIKGCDKSSSVSSCGSGSNGANNGKSHMGGARSRESKTTRVRTVLNEKQLNTLRACYAANPRPDALMKEQLVEMTGLSPRVIRVWFQNKRCKDKKKSMLMKLQAQHLSSSDKVAALQSAIPLIAQDAMGHSSESPIHGSEVPIHAFSQSAWKSLADFAMNADIEPSSSFQQFVNGMESGKGLPAHMRPGFQRAHPHHQNGRHHNTTTSDGISDDDDDEIDEDDVIDDDDDLMMMGGGGSASGSGMASTSPNRGGATTATTNTSGTGGDDESAGSFMSSLHQQMAQQQRHQQLLVDSSSAATLCNRL